MVLQVVESVASEHKISQLRAAVLIFDLLTDIKKAAQDRADKKRDY